MIVEILMRELSEVADKKAEVDDHGNIVLRLPQFYLVFGILVSVISIVLGIFLSTVISKDELPLLIGSFSALFLVGLWIIHYAYYSKIYISKEAMRQDRLFGERKEIKWNEIEKVSFGSISQELKIKNSRHQIKAHFHMIGFKDFFNAIEKSGISIENKKM